MIPKFRVAFKNNILCEVGSIDFVDEAVTIPVYDKLDGEYLGDNVWGLNQVTLMQSTGLFDKNGKEIFEGDVVIAWSQGVKGAFEIKRRIDGLWLLYPSWKDGQFWYLSPTEDGRETIEIIGNVYENPELVEE